MAARIELHLPRPHPAQRRVLDERRRFNVLAGGRRLGKSVLIETILIKPALDGLPVGYFAPTYKLLAEQWRELVVATKPVTRAVNNTERRIELITGGTIDAWTLKNNPDAGRSRKYAIVGIDEAASAPNLEQAWTEAIRATLTDLRGEAWFVSSPKGVNYFAHLYARGQSTDPADADWMSWQMPTSANPFIAPEEIEWNRRDMPEQVFRQEYLAEFLDMEGAVFRKVQSAVDADVEVDEPIPGHEYAFGVDWGKHNDWTVITVLDLTTKAAVHIDRFNQIDYQVQLGRLESLAAIFQPRVIKPEANSIGEPLIEQLRAKGLPIQPFTTTNSTKAVIIDALSVAFDSGTITIPDNQTLISELIAYEAERLPGGLLRYGAPMGQHDDTVMSLAIAWSCLSSGYNWDEAYGLVLCGACGRKYTDRDGNRPCPYCRTRRG